LSEKVYEFDISLPGEKSCENTEVIYKKQARET